MSEVTTIRRVLICHARHVEDDVLANMVNTTKRLLSAQKLQDGSVVAPAIVTARDSFIKWHEKRSGPANYNGWIGWITGTTTPFGAEPRFHVFLVPQPRIGKATAQIVETALRLGRVVVCLTDNADGILRVRRVVRLDEHDFQTGWVVAG